MNGEISATNMPAIYIYILNPVMAWRNILSGLEFTNLGWITAIINKRLQIKIAKSDSLLTVFMGYFWGAKKHQSP